jgi:hypothetical protein
LALSYQIFERLSSGGWYEFSSGVSIEIRRHLWFHPVINLLIVLVRKEILTVIPFFPRSMTLGLIT